MTTSCALAVSRSSSRHRIPTSPPRTGWRYFVIHTKWYLQSQTVWLPRLYASIQPVYMEAPQSQPPKGVGFPDPLSGTLKTGHLVKGGVVTVMIQIVRNQPHD